jgi:hypothetical protein
MAMDGKERAQRCRDKKKTEGLTPLISNFTATERSWIQEAQDLGGYQDHAELILVAVQEYIEKHKKAR